MSIKSFILILVLTSCAGQKNTEENKAEAEIWYNKAHDILLNTTHNALSHVLAKQALEYANNAIALYPEDSRYYRVRASCFYHLKVYDSALANHEQAIKLDPGNFLAWMGKGLVYENTGRYALAEESYLEALALGPNSPSIYHNLGLLYSKWGKDSLSIVNYTRSIELDPGNGSRYVNRGHTKLLNKMYESAIEDFNRGIDYDTTDKLSYNNRGLCKFYLGRYREAIADYQKALSIRLGKSFDENFDVDKYSTNNIANAYFAMGNKKEACDYWQRAVQMGYKYEPRWKKEYNIDDPAELLKKYCK